MSERDLYFQHDLLETAKIEEIVGRRMLGMSIKALGSRHKRLATVLLEK